MVSENEKDLEATYGPAALFSEHKRGDHISYTNGRGEASSGVIIWVQARFENIPMKYVVAPDDDGFLDFALPGDVITQDAPSSDTLIRCPYCNQMHLANQVEQCPLKPK